MSAATFAACLAVLTLALGSVDAARLFAANVVGGLNNGLAFYHGIFVVIIPYIRAESVLVAAMGGILVGWLGGAPGRTRVIFAIALPALFGFAVLTGLKVGSGPNYFNEFTFAATAAVAYALQTRGTHSSPRQDWLIMAGALYATVLLPVRTIENVYQFSYGRSEPASLRPLRSTQLEAYDELTSFLAANTDPARGEYIVTFDRGLMTILPFHTITPQTELASDRYRQGLSDLREFTALVKAGRVKYVVFLRGQIWPDYLGLTLSEHFEHFRDYPGQVVFRYRERP